MKKLFSVTRTVSTTTDVVVDDVVADRMINAIDRMDPAVAQALGIQINNAFASSRQAGAYPMPHFYGSPAPVNAEFAGAPIPNDASPMPASDGASPSEAASPPSPVAASDGSPACATCVGRPGLTPAGTPCPDCTK